MELSKSADNYFKNNNSTKQRNTYQPRFYQTPNDQSNNNNNNNNYGDNNSREKEKTGEKPSKPKVTFNPDASEFVFKRK